MLSLLLLALLRNLLTAVDFVWAMIHYRLSLSDTAALLLRRHGCVVVDDDSISADDDDSEI